MQLQIQPDTKHPDPTRSHALQSVWTQLNIAAPVFSLICIACFASACPDRQRTFLQMLLAALEWNGSCVPVYKATLVRPREEGQ